MYVLWKNCCVMFGVYRCMNKLYMWGMNRADTRVNKLYVRNAPGRFGMPIDYYVSWKNNLLRCEVIVIFCGYTHTCIYMFFIFELKMWWFWNKRWLCGSIYLWWIMYDMWDMLRCDGDCLWIHIDIYTYIYIYVL